MVKRNRRRGNGRNTTGNAPAATATRNKRINNKSGTQTIVMSGSGRICTATCRANTEDGHVLCSDIVVPGMFPRLSRIASSFQRYRFTKLSFTVEPYAPTTAAGGYIAGFVPDPTDGKTDFDTLQSTRGSRVGKWWEASTVQAKLAKDVLWTSEAENVRLHSPGKFAVVSVGRASTDVGFSVVGHWTIELSVPSIEELSGGAIERVLVVKESLLSTDIGADSNLIAVSAIAPDEFLAPGELFRLDNPLTIDAQAGAGNTETAQYDHLKVINLGTHFQWGYYSGGQFVPGTNKATGSSLPTGVALIAGTILTQVGN